MPLGGEAVGLYHLIRTDLGIIGSAEGVDTVRHRHSCDFATVRRDRDRTIPVAQNLFVEIDTQVSILVGVGTSNALVDGVTIGKHSLEITLVPGNCLNAACSHVVRIHRCKLHTD